MTKLGLKFDEVKLEKYNSTWSKNFLVEKKSIEDLNLSSISQVEHVGSTAIPGMVAKPIIDIIVGIERYSDYKKLIKPLSRIGYHFYREPRRYQAIFLKKLPNDQTTHHLKVVKYDGKSWREYIKFREALKSDEKLFNEYKQLKLALSKVTAIDRKTYTAGKHGLIQRIIK